MQPDLRQYINAVWIAIGVLWAAAAFWTKRTARSQTAGSRVIHILLAAAGFTMLFTDRLSFRPFSWRFVPDSAVIGYTGLALPIAGAGFAAWARLYLGRNWSAVVTIKQDHRIVRSGPYAVVRHPIYSGGLLAFLGTAMAFGEVRGLIALGLVFIAWWTKLRLEESFLETQFGAEYVQYRQEVKALIPFVL